MTRVLSELLGASEPLFQQALSRLEAASGHQSTDIHLSTDVESTSKQKLKQLGLDPQDTTAEELYEVLKHKVETDDKRLNAKLRELYGQETGLEDLISKALLDIPISKNCFALKTAVGKRLLKKLPPKHTMKALGYRSFDSMMRREQVVAVFAAAWALESATWKKTLLDHYKKLNSGDFEIRPMIILSPKSKQWLKLADSLVKHKKHNIVGLKEYGSIVIFPLPDNRPPAITMATLLLGLHEMNEVRAGSTFFKLCHVKANFGDFVVSVLVDQPVLSADLLDGPVPWQIIQKYYSRFSDRFRSDLFEPHIQQEDLSWHSIERALSHIEPKLEFWHQTASLGFLHNHQPVSLNIIDAALNACNQLPYSNRIVHYFRHNLWYELIIRYLNHENVEQAVLSSLESQLVEEPALI